MRQKVKRELLENSREEVVRLVLRNSKASTSLLTAAAVASDGDVSGAVAKESWDTDGDVCDGADPEDHAVTFDTVVSVNTD